MATIIRPPVHLIDYGDAMGGKSLAASTFPKPMLVSCFDPPGKESPYFRCGEVDEIDAVLPGVPTWGVYDKDGELLIQVERYLDLDPEHPVAWDLFRKRVRALYKEMDCWKTVVADSLTFAEIAARYESQFKLNASVADPRRHYGHATEEIERVIMVRLGALPCNVVITAHIDEQIVHDDTRRGVSVAVKDEVNGILVRNASAPGRLKKRLPAGFNSLFRSYVEISPAGKRFLWQTEIGEGWNAGSQICQPPNPCIAWPGGYDNLWTEEA